MHVAIGGYYGYDLYDECGAENIIAKLPEVRRLVASASVRVAVVATRTRTRSS